MVAFAGSQGTPDSLPGPDAIQQSGSASSSSGLQLAYSRLILRHRALYLHQHDFGLSHLLFTQYFSLGFQFKVCFCFLLGAVVGYMVV